MLFSWYLQMSNSYIYLGVSKISGHIKECLFKGWWWPMVLHHGSPSSNFLISPSIALQQGNKKSKGPQISQARRVLRACPADNQRTNCSLDICPRPQDHLDAMVAESECGESIICIFQHGFGWLCQPKERKLEFSIALRPNLVILQSTMFLAQGEAPQQSK